MHQYHVKLSSSKEKFYPIRALPEKLIDVEMPEPANIRHNVPGVVARLMGVDMLPLDAKPSVNAKDRRNRSSRKIAGENDKTKNHLTPSSPPRTKHIKEIRYDFLTHGFKRDPDYCYENLTLSELQPRQHPQEEQLQKFKKEFEAWQASMSWEYSRSPELESSPNRKNNQTPSQDNFYKEMMSDYLDSRRSASLFDGSHHHECKSKQRNRSKSYDLARIPLINRDEKCSRSPLRTKVVLLKPGPGRTNKIENFCIDSPEAVKDESGTEEFLNRVKEKLEFELKGNVKREPNATGVGFFPLSEKQTDPKEIAQLIAKKVRESVTREFKTKLPQSESTQLYRREGHLYRSEFINKEPKTSLSERLRNVLVSEKNVEIPFLFNKSSVTSLLDGNKERLMTARHVQTDAHGMNQWGPWGDMQDPGAEIKSFGYEQSKDDAYGSSEVLLKNPTRSVSTSLSRTSLRKLLSDKTGALESTYIRRTHEAMEDIPLEERKASKHKVGFRGNVSNLRHSFNLRGKLFGRKFHSVQDLKDDEFDIMKAFMTDPSVTRNFGYPQDNSTELPPSPASMCSSPCREYSKPGDYSSPVSTLDAPCVEYHPMPQAFKEISSSLYDLRRQLDQVQFSKSKEVDIREENSELNVGGLEDEARSYIRNVLAAAGFYDEASRPTCPIQSKVFDEVESAYRRTGQEGNETVKACGERNVDHKLLFDLLNEALSAVTRPYITRSRFMRGLVGPTVVPNGKKLLDHVWRMIHTHVHPQEDEPHSFDGMVANDIAKSAWSDRMQGETEVLGREMECVILRELVEEIMMDMCEIVFNLSL